MRTLDRNGYRLHLKLDGPEDGAPVLFVNSLGTDLRVWDALLPLLPAGLRVIRYDKPGHGLSDAPAAPYRMDDLVADAAAALDAAGARDAVIVGLSIGGLIAQGLSAKRPELVRALALLDTGHKIGTDEIWNDRIRAVETGGIESMADAIMERWFSPEFRAREPQLSLWRNMVTRTTPDGYAGCSAAIRDADYTAVARSIAKPTLCVVGTLDGATPPALVREMSELIPGARYAEIDGVGHLPCVEAPTDLAGVLNPFLSENAAA